MFYKKLKSIEKRVKKKEHAKNRYKNLNQEEKNRLVENCKAWFNRQSEEKQNEMRRKAREYAKNRYHNFVITVK